MQRFVPLLSFLVASLLTTVSATAALSTEKSPSSDLSGIRKPDLKAKDPFVASSDEIEARKAIKEITESSEWDPEDPWVLGTLSIMYDRVGEYENEIKTLNRMIRLCPDENRAYNNLGRAYSILGHYDRAVKMLRKALALNNKEPFTYHGLAVAYASKGDHEKALECTRRLLEIDPEYLNAHLGLAQWYHFQRDDTDKAIEVLKQALGMGIKRAALYTDLGIYYREKGIIAGSPKEKKKYFDKALGAVQTGIALEPDFIKAYLVKGDTYAEMAIFGKEDVRENYLRKALFWYSALLKKDPLYPYAKALKAQCHLLLKEYDKAIAELGPTYKQAPNDLSTKSLLAAAYNGKAYALYKEGRMLQSALEIVDEAIALDTEDKTFYVGTRGEILYKMGRYEEALEHVQASLKDYPDNEEMREDIKNVQKAMEGRKESLSKNH